MSDQRDAERFRLLMKIAKIDMRDSVEGEWVIRIPKEGAKNGEWYDYGNLRTCCDEAMKNKP